MREHADPLYALLVEELPDVVRDIGERARRQPNVLAPGPTTGGLGAAVRVKRRW